LFNLLDNQFVWTGTTVWSYDDKNNTVLKHVLKCSPYILKWSAYFLSLVNRKRSTN